MDHSKMEFKHVLALPICRAIPRFPSLLASNGHHQTLSPEGAWHQKRLETLRKASDSCADPEQVFKEGLVALEIHRNKYDAFGPSPTQLQLLWWEFPPEHWTPLREGSRMNFLRLPEPVIKPNAYMDNEQRDVGAAFVDKLLELKVLGLLDDDDILLNAPLFVVPKEGQEGEWQVIADMLRGGQNMCIGNNPVILPRISHVLDLMYEGGYSAVVDASKNFISFPPIRTIGNILVFSIRLPVCSMRIGGFQWGQARAPGWRVAMVWRSFGPSSQNLRNSKALEKLTAGGQGSPTLVSTLPKGMVLLWSLTTVQPF
jgi:hypothetical protein